MSRDFVFISPTHLHPACKTTKNKSKLKLEDSITGPNKPKFISSALKQFKSNKNKKDIPAKNASSDSNQTQIFYENFENENLEKISESSVSKFNNTKNSPIQKVYRYENEIKILKNTETVPQQPSNKELPDLLIDFGVDLSAYSPQAPQSQSTYFNFDHYTNIRPGDEVVWLPQGKSTLVTSDHLGKVQDIQSNQKNIEHSLSAIVNFDHWLPNSLDDTISCIITDSNKRQYCQRIIPVSKLCKLQEYFQDVPVVKIKRSDSTYQDHPSSIASPRKINCLCRPCHLNRSQTEIIMHPVVLEGDTISCNSNGVMMKGRVSKMILNNGCLYIMAEFGEAVYQNKLSHNTYCSNKFICDKILMIDVSKLTKSVWDSEFELLSLNVVPIEFKDLSVPLPPQCNNEQNLSNLQSQTLASKNIPDTLIGSSILEELQQRQQQKQYSVDTKSSGFSNKSKLGHSNNANHMHFDICGPSIESTKRQRPKPEIPSVDNRSINISSYPTQFFEKKSPKTMPENTNQIRLTINQHEDKTEATAPLPSKFYNSLPKNDFEMYSSTNEKQRELKSTLKEEKMAKANNPFSDLVSSKGLFPNPTEDNCKLPSTNKSLQKTQYTTSDKLVIHSSEQNITSSNTKILNKKPPIASRPINYEYKSSKIQPSPLEPENEEKTKSELQIIDDNDEKINENWEPPLEEFLPPPPPEWLSDFNGELDKDVDQEIICHPNNSIETKNGEREKTMYQISQERNILLQEIREGISLKRIDLANKRPIAKSSNGNGIASILLGAIQQRRKEIEDENSDNGRWEEEDLDDESWA